MDLPIAVANEITITNIGLLLMLFGTWGAQFWHARDCQNRRKRFHEQDEAFGNRLTAIERDIHWIREHITKEN